MVSHQQVRCNLTPGEIIYANSMVADEIVKELNMSKQNEFLYSNSIQDKICKYR